VPVLLYSIPKYMHFALPPELVLELAKHENIAGMKDSSGDATLFSRYMEARSDSFHVMTGSAGLLTEALRMGADGGILAAALFAPSLALEIFAAVKGGDVARTDAAQARMAPLGARIVGAMGVPGVKAALDAVGLRGGEPRLPLLPLESTLRGELMQLLAAAGLSPTGCARAWQRVAPAPSPRTRGSRVPPDVPPRTARAATRNRCWARPATRSRASPFRIRPFQGDTQRRSAERSVR
jgi:dihydrodipicolinate synthase/N-acetylneuraminate lyase